MSVTPDAARVEPAIGVPAPERSAPPRGRWPHALSHDPLMRVSDVLALVQAEFPALSPSKLRFLDAQGLVSPQRTGSGYRQYSPADVERLRFVLREQRDHYRPLTVIAERLAELDAGHARQEVVPHVVPDVDAPWVTVAELARLADVPTDLVIALEELGLIAERMTGKYSRDSVTLVHAASRYLDAGGDLRSLKVLRNAATREGELARQSAAPVRARGAAGEAQHAAQEFADAAAQLFAAVTRSVATRD